MAGDERREQLCQIAMRLFSERGFRGTTTKEIATAAGVSEAVIFKHFQNKDELYSAILDHKACSPEFDDPFHDVKEFIERKDDFGLFYNLGLHMLTHHEQDCDFMRLMLHSALEGHGLAKIFFDRVGKRFYEALGAYIRQRQEDGAFREIEPMIVVRAFIGMHIHHSMNNILWDREQSLLAVSNEAAAHSFATILVEGLKRR
jgi:TetR/AcrR family transcriptional regulator